MMFKVYLTIYCQEIASTAKISAALVKPMLRCALIKIESKSIKMLFNPVVFIEY